MAHTYPTQPVVGVGGIILEGDRVLLVRRGNEPLKGSWSIPGGKLHLGEKLVDAVRREIREEVNLEVRVLDIVEVFERIMPDTNGRIAYHYVLVDYLCEPLSGEMRAGDDAAEAEWVARRQFPSYQITEGTPEVIEKAFQLRQRLLIRSG
jgi:mutator protein MutT